jgi:glycosyltransferase involved in cell wall biosynthesis
MKILYDHQIFEHQVHGGISRYFYELMKGIALQSTTRVEFALPIRNSSNHYLQNIPSVAKGITSGSEYYNDFMNGIEFPGKWRLFQFWQRIMPFKARENQLQTIEQLKAFNYDIFHPTDVDDYFLKYIGKKPFVITIHDLIDEYFPEYGFHVHSLYKTSARQRLLEASAGIIAVSEFTKKNLIERFGVDEKKIKVIHHGVGEIGVQEDHRVRAISERYLLYIGKRTHYKNFYFFVQCVQSVLLQQPDLKIVCAGAPFNPREIAYFRDLRVEKQIVHVHANDNMLSNLYIHAEAFIYPSLYEGFGMPVLEAFKYRCPVLLSNTSSMPEVAGDAALYFPPKDVTLIRSSVEKILSDQMLRSQLIEKGLSRVRHFSWERAVTETLLFYETVLSGKQK